LESARLPGRRRPSGQHRPAERGQSRKNPDSNAGWWPLRHKDARSVDAAFRSNRIGVELQGISSRCATGLRRTQSNPPLYPSALASVDFHAGIGLPRYRRRSEEFIYPGPMSCLTSRRRCRWISGCASPPSPRIRDNPGAAADRPDIPAWRIAAALHRDVLRPLW
jgi:hypothetical protein